MEEHQIDLILQGLKDLHNKLSVQENTQQIKQKDIEPSGAILKFDDTKD